MPQVMPASCEVWFKERNQPVSAIRMGVHLTDPTIDANEALALIQNQGKIPVIFNEDLDKYDLFYRSLSAENVGKVIRIKNKAQVSTLSSALNADSEQDSFTIDNPTTDSALKVGDLIQVGDEYMHITTINKSAGSWAISIDDRGVHGSGIDAHNAGTEVYYCEFSVPYTPITLSEMLTSAPPTPTNLKAWPADSAIHLSWDWAGDKTELKRYLIYYDTSTGVTETQYENVIDGGVSNNAVFRPIDAFGMYRVSETFYFRVQAENTVGVTSDLSNEASASLGSTGTPTPDGPPTPEVTLIAVRPFVLEAWARWPATAKDTESTSKQCELEIYRGSTQDLVSATPSDTLLHDVTDLYKPYRTEKGVSDALPQDYWARARFTDKNDAVGSWGGSGVFNLSEEDNTSDTDVPSTITMDQDVIRVYTVEGIAGPKYMNTVLVGVQATVNADSVTQTEVHIEERTLSDPTWTTFSTSTGFADPNWLDMDTTIAPWISTFEMDPGKKYRMTARVKNVYGWSDFASPEIFQLSLDIDSNNNLEDDSPTIDSFELYTTTNQASPPVNMGGNQAAVRVRLGDDNESTWLIYIEGNTSATWPTETEFCNETDGTLVTDSTSYTVNVTNWTGSAVTLNSLAGKVLRQGNDTGKSSGWFLQENSIGGNTAESSGSFEITLRRPYPPRGTGTVPEWSIVDNVTRNLVDYHKTIRVDTTGFADTGANYIIKDKIIDIDVPGNYYFRARAHNYHGRSAGGSSTPYIYADTSDGTFLVANQALKSIVGVDTDDLADDAVDPTKISNDAMPVGTDIVFTPLTYNSFSWTAGDIYFADDTTQAINSGSATSLANGTHWVYATLGSATLATTQTEATAFGVGKILLAMCIVDTSNTEETCSILAAWAKGTRLSAHNIYATKLSAITASLGTINTGTINTNGQLNLNAGADIVFTASDTNPSRLVWGSTVEFKQYTTDGRLYILPLVTTSAINIGLESSAEFQSVGIATNDTLTGTYIVANHSSTAAKGTINITPIGNALTFQSTNPECRYAMDDTNYHQFKVGSTTELQVDGDGITVPGTTTFNTVEYTWPSSAPAANGYVLSCTTGGTMSWIESSGVVVADVKQATATDSSYTTSTYFTILNITSGSGFLDEIMGSVTVTDEVADLDFRVTIDSTAQTLAYTSDVLDAHYVDGTDVRRHVILGGARFESSLKVEVYATAGTAITGKVTYREDQ